MRDLTPQPAGALCFDPTLADRPRLRLRRQADPTGTVIHATGLVACPRWIQPTFDALAELTEHGHDLAILRGNRIAALVSSQYRTPPTALRRLQFRRHDDPLATTSLAHSLITAKTAGQQAILRRAALTTPTLGERADDLARLRRGQGTCRTIDALRGLEGLIARTYFGGWPRLLGLPSFQRIPRRALNPVNLLLDLTYSRLCLSVTQGLIDAGLDLALGTLHAEDDRRPTLALDLMEPLRPLIADRFVIACHAHALEGGWLAQTGTRWTLTPTGRSRFRERWKTWFYGSDHRPGHMEHLTSTIATYRAWLEGATTLPWPTYRG